MMTQTPKRSTREYERRENTRFPVTPEQMLLRLKFYAEWLDELRTSHPPHTEPAHTGGIFVESKGGNVDYCIGDFSVGAGHPYFDALAHLTYELEHESPRGTPKLPERCSALLCEAAKEYPNQLSGALATRVPELLHDSTTLRGWRQHYVHNKKKVLRHRSTRRSEKTVARQLDITLVMRGNEEENSVSYNLNGLINSDGSVTTLEGALFPYLPLPARLTIVEGHLDISASVNNTLQIYSPPGEPVGRNMKESLTELLAHYDCSTASVDAYILKSITSMAREAEQHIKTQPEKGDDNDD